MNLYICYFLLALMNGCDILLYLHFLCESLNEPLHLPFPFGAYEWLRYFIMVLPVPSINYNMCYEIEHILLPLSCIL